MSPSDPSPDRLCLGVSSCLLGESVRYDGGDKRDDVLLEQIGPYVRWLPVCPEVEMGLGVPRPPIQLEQTVEGERLRGVESRRDVTEEMVRCARDLLAVAEQERVSGFVLKSRSPSCGVDDAPLHDGKGRVRRTRDGAFTAAVRAALPDLPVVSEQTLHDPYARESFLAAVDAYEAFRAVRRGRIGLRPFHRRYRFVVAARAPDMLTRLRSLRDAGGVDAYSAFFFAALEEPGGADEHARVLRTLASLVMREAPRGGVRGVSAALDAYENGAGSLRAAVDALAHAVREGGVLALAEDAYLHPGPARRRAYREL